MRDDLVWSEFIRFIMMQCKQIRHAVRIGVSTQGSLRKVYKHIDDDKI